MDYKQHLFNELVIINHCKYPNFKSVDFLAKLKADTPAQALKAAMKIGEQTILANEILKFNGFDDDWVDTQKAAKN